MNINRQLRRFNEWFDMFILEAIKPLAIMSMMLGTIAVFNVSELAIQPWYVMTWAIVQAASIDCTFFAVFDRLFDARKSWQALGLVFVGFVLSLIAVFINAVLGFQILWMLGSSQLAMNRLGISSSLFTIVRAILAVTVFIMIAFVRRSSGKIVSEQEAIVSVQEEIEPMSLLPLKHQEVFTTIHSQVNTEHPPVNTDKRDRVHCYLSEHPQATVSEIVNTCGVSRGYASQLRKTIESSRQAL